LSGKCQLLGSKEKLTTRQAHPKTKKYVNRKLAEGRSKHEIMRRLKRYIAREVYHVLIAA